MQADEIIQFWQNGALLVRNFMSAEDTLNLRREIEAYIPEWKRQKLIATTLTGGRLVTDLLANPLLKKIVINQDLIRVVHGLLNAQPVYFGDSTFVYGPTGRGWHRDNRTSDRTSFNGLDWQGQYPLIRIGIYLQDHEQHSGGLGIRIGSHQPYSKMPFIHTKILPAKIKNFLANRTGYAVHMDSKPGDLVIWTLRTLHSADSVKLKIFSKLRLPTFIENKTPKWAKLANDGLRMACFMTFAAASEHLNRYLDYLQTRDYMQDIWRYSTWQEDDLRLAKQAGLIVMPKKYA